MGTTFTHFNPLSDENGLGLQDRFTSKSEKTDDIYCIFVSNDICRKYKVNDKSAPVEMIDYTPKKLFRFIFGYVFKHYKNGSTLLQVNPVFIRNSKLLNRSKFDYGILSLKQIQ